MNGLVRHGPRAKGPEKADSRDQADDPDDVEDEPDKDPDPLSLEVALIVRFLRMVCIIIKRKKARAFICRYLLYLA